MRTTFDPDSPIIILKVEISGPKGSYKIDMALDTGASYSMMPLDISERLGYESISNRETITITTASSRERVPLIEVESLKIGDIQANDVDIILHDIPPQSRIDGLLGLSFLKNFKVTIDFPKGILEIE